jgi:DNA polymerase I
MQFILQPGVSLLAGRFNAVVAPEHTITGAINRNTGLQRYLFLFVCGNYSRILNGISGNTKTFEIRRAFTAHQMLTILKESSHTIIFIEHDPTLYDEARTMIAPIAGTLKEISHDLLMILYSPKPDQAFCSLIRDAGRIYFLTPASGMRKCPACYDSPPAGGGHGSRKQSLQKQMQLPFF